MDPTRRSFLKLAAVAAAGASPMIAACTRLAKKTTAGGTGAFLSAARAGDLESVRRLLAADRGLLAATDAAGRSAYALAQLEGHAAVGKHLVEQGYLADLHEAALAGDWERFKLLTGPDQDLAAVDGDHPLGGSAMVAAAIGGVGIEIWRVYAATGHPNALPRGAQGVSPLQAALRFRDLATAEMTAATLLSNAADPNPPTRVEDSPLHIAAERGSVDLVEMLIRHGAAVDARDRRRRTPAAVAGNGAVAALLARHAEIPRTHSTSRAAYDATGRPYAPPEIGGIPLTVRNEFVGQSHFNMDRVQEAMAADPRLAHSVATTGEICVEACAHTGRTPIVDLLLQHGAPYSLPTAVMRNDIPRVKQLLDEDPLRIHERGAHDFALLWYPIIGDTGTELLELLLARGADVEQQHVLGTTALHWACKGGAIEVVDLLIEHGADVNRRGRKFGAEGQTPLQCAIGAEQHEIAELLKQRGATA